MRPIKNFENYSMAHQYMPNTFHEPHKNPPAPPPTYLMYVSLSLEALEQCYLVKLVSNVLRKISQPRHIRFYE